MSHIQAIPFRLVGDPGILSDEHDDVDLVLLKAQKLALLYAFPNERDKVSHIDINIVIAADGMFYLNRTLKERELDRSYRALSDEMLQNISLEQFREIFRRLLLHYDKSVEDYGLDEENMLGGYFLESELIVLPGGTSHYKLWLNMRSKGKKNPSPVKSERKSVFSFLSVDKHVCEFTLGFDDELVDSKGDPIDTDELPGLTGYAIASCEENKRHVFDKLKYQITQKVQDRKIKELTDSVSAIKDQYQQDLAKVQYTALRLVNSKKQMIAKLIEFLEGADIDIDDNEVIEIINDKDVLHSKVQKTIIDEDEDEEDDETMSEGEEPTGESSQGKNGAKKRKMKTKSKKKDKPELSRKINPFRNRVITRKKEVPFSMSSTKSGYEEYSDGEGNKTEASTNASESASTEVSSSNEDELELHEMNPIKRAAASQEKSPSKIQFRPKYSTTANDLGKRKLKNEFQFAHGKFKEKKKERVIDQDGDEDMSVLSSEQDTSRINNGKTESIAECDDGMTDVSTSESDGN